MRGPDLFFAAIALGVLPAVACAQQGYDLFDLTPASPYESITLNSINNAGHMTGYGVIAGTGEIHAFICRSNNFQDLGLLGYVGSSRVDLQACKLEYSIVSPK